MPPKKDKKGGEPDPAKKAGLFTEVERTFLEVQLAEANRKVGRLRLAVDEYEIQNEELQKAYEKLDEDRADIIAYLKKTLNVKTEENVELKEKVRGLEETREIETAQFKATVTELEKNFTTMKDQLTSENKLLAGKLNTLEEFRAIRDDLMRKYEKQEQDFKDQEMKYKRIIYDAEKKFVIGKDKLKKEMEARLLKLAQDFQDATELRIAASTHRVIRENIAINNELDSILITQAKLAEQNEKYKETCIAANVAMELAEEERDKAINKNVVQLKVIDQLTTAFQTVKKEKALFEKHNIDVDSLQNKIQKLTKENSDLSLTVRILEQNLHGNLNDQNKVVAEASKVAKECAKLKKILKEAAIAIQAALKLDAWAAADASRVTMDRGSLLSRLLDIVTQYHEGLRAESMDTIASLGKVYEEGDLGFVPKRPKKSIASSLAAAIASQMSVGTEKLGSATISISSASLGSIKTIPSVQLLPASSDLQVGFKDSLPSFITSTKSSVSESVELDEDEEDDEIAQQLKASKAELKKSIMKDLAMSREALTQSKEVHIKMDGEEVEEEEDGEKEEGGEKKGEHAKGEGVEEEEKASEKGEAGVQGEEDEA